MLTFIVVGTVLGVIGGLWASSFTKPSSTFKATATPKDPRLMSYEAKQKYLKSVQWNFIRSLVLARDNHKCAVCGATHNLQVHHITYERLGNEQGSDLATLCATHHQAIHDKLGYSQFNTYPVEALNE